jgi:hypothetical protein
LSGPFWPHAGRARTSASAMAARVVARIIRAL